MEEKVKQRDYDEESPLLDNKTDNKEPPLRTIVSNPTAGLSSTEQSKASETDDFSLSGMPIISVPLGMAHHRDAESSVISHATYDTEHVRFIRFQVVVWYVGRPDEVLGKVDMKFRVTIFWNAPDEKDNEEGYGMNNPFNKKVWKMHGRQRAYKAEIQDVGENGRIVYVPPVSILNAVDFEVLGDPEVCLLNTEENLMKWSCLYKASLQQDDMHVAEFPHDSHDLVLRLGILKHRQRRKRWDQTKWKLELATKYDTQETIEIPHGTIVDHVKVPGFSFKGAQSLHFKLRPLEFGSVKVDGRDQCLQVHLRVTRESSYYDRNIIPLLAALNTIGVCTLALHPTVFEGRGEMILAIAFVEIGIRMTVDSRLPVVGYQIKMQWVLNNYFYGLLFLVAESAFVYLLTLHDDIHLSVIKTVDIFCAIFEFCHMLLVLTIYFLGSGTWLDRMCCSFFKHWFRYNNLNTGG